jgi:hypothetical protein
MTSIAFRTFSAARAWNSDRRARGAARARDLELL